MNHFVLPSVLEVIIFVSMVLAALSNAVQICGVRVYVTICILLVLE
jgi:hypothetical protein